MRPELVYNVPATLLERYLGRKVIVRSTRPAEIVDRLKPDQLPQVRFVQLLAMPADIGPLEPWANGLPIDVVLTNPANEFSRLYDYSTLRETHPVRVTVPVAPGFAKAVRVAVALGFAVKLNVGQPDPTLFEELSAVVDFYLHGATVQQPIEFFQTALLSFYQPQPISFWEVSEEDPRQVRYVTDDGEETISPRFTGRVPAMKLNEFVERFRGQMLSEKGECHDCEFYSRCQGYFKWPDPTYSCAGIRKVLTTLQDAARELKSDLQSLAAVQGGLSR